MKFIAQKTDKNEIDFKNKGEVKLFISRLKAKEFEVIIRAKSNQRSLKQNNSLHLYFQLLADALNDAGLDMKKVLKPGVDISWTMGSVKEYLWRPIQKFLLRKSSTTKLKTDEIDRVYDHLNRHLGEKFGLENIPFPNINAIIND